jgi:hypothetical protein
MLHLVAGLPAAGREPACFLAGPDKERRDANNGLSGHNVGQLEAHNVVAKRHSTFHLHVPQPEAQYIVATKWPLSRSDHFVTRRSDNQHYI